MENLKSPWTYQLQRNRPLYILETDVVADVCIIGGGISGVMTAYYILKYTNHKVLLIDAVEIAHGATGHNGGQLVAELERSLTSLVAEYGLQESVEALKCIESAWLMLEEVIRDAELTMTYSTFIGYDVYTTETQIHNRLADLALAHEGGLHNRKMYIAEEFLSKMNIPENYSQYYEVIPHESILSLCESINPAYIAAYPLRKGCLNSAVLTEQLISYLIATYGIKRIEVYEKSPVTSVLLKDNHAEIEVASGKKITAKKVIMCTNGFEHFKIEAEKDNLDFTFHKHVKGLVGYMYARTENMDQNPSARAYFGKEADEPDEIAKQLHVDPDRDIIYKGEYIYATRRPYDLGDNAHPKNLFCLGGKEYIMEDSSLYSKDHVYGKEIKDDFEQFAKENFEYKKADEGHIEFVWHGLMGYTANGLRMVGFDPRHDVLMYNLGCNGIGLLPSIWSSKRIATLLNGDTTPSLFDPVFDPEKA
ncbi:MAG: hypothetical protein RJB39_365 [Candidatus Parcubacteria bacterium]|jgi:glycine/D-amino acid oxidase-like deaminating enzyme